MSLVPKGVAVQINHSTRQGRDHSFEVDEIVVSVGQDLKPTSARGDWSLFKNEEGTTQYLLAEHYNVLSPVDSIVESVALETEKPKVEKAKAVYAVVDANDDVKATTVDRDLARDFKAALGGKRKGIRIFQYSNAKEIR